MQFAELTFEMMAGPGKADFYDAAVGFTAAALCQALLNEPVYTMRCCGERQAEQLRQGRHWHRTLAAEQGDRMSVGGAEFESGVNIRNARCYQFLHHLVHLVAEPDGESVVNFLAWVWNSSSFEVFFALCQCLRLADHHYF